MSTIEFDITDVNKNDWVYQANRNGRIYRQNMLVLKLRAAGIPAEGVKAFQGVYRGSYKLEYNDDRLLVVWSE